MADITMSKTEKAVMTEIYLMASAKGKKCLIKPIDLLASVPYNVELQAEELEGIVQNLCLDGYFTFDISDKKGETYYLIELTNDGNAFRRELQKDKRSKRNQFIFKIMLAVSGAAAAAVVRLVIYALGGK